MQVNLIGERMKQSEKVISLNIRGLFIIISLILIIINSQACFLLNNTDCRWENKVLSETPSPNGKLKAIVFSIEFDEMNSGNCPGTATGDGVEGVSILPIDEKPPTVTAKGNAISSNKKLTLEWVNENELSVTGDYSADDFPTRTISGVTVKYKKR